MIKRCGHPDCPETFTSTYGPGRPCLYCPRHRSTKYAMIRSRKHPELREARIAAMPPCCRPLGRMCPQHLSMAKQQMNCLHSEAEQAVISELLDVWGHVALWSDTGYVYSGIDAL